MRPRTESSVVRQSTFSLSQTESVQLPFFVVDRVERDTSRPRMAWQYHGLRKNLRSRSAWHFIRGIATPSVGIILKTIERPRGRRRPGAQSDHFYALMVYNPIDGLSEIRKVRLCNGKASARVTMWKTAGGCRGASRC